MTEFAKPVTLVGHHATLEPLRPEHADGLRAACADGELWKLWYTSVPAPERMDAEIARRLGLQDQGSMLPTAASRSARPGTPSACSAAHSIRNANCCC